MMGCMYLGHRPAGDDHWRQVAPENVGGLYHLVLDTGVGHDSHREALYLRVGEVGQVKTCPEVAAGESMDHLLDVCWAVLEVRHMVVGEVVRSEGSFEAGAGNLHPVRRFDLDTVVFCRDAGEDHHSGMDDHLDIDLVGLAYREVLVGR